MNKDNEFKITLDVNWFKPMYRNSLHKFLCKYLPFIFRPNNESLIAESGGVLLEVLSKPKGCMVKSRNPWYKFWLPKYNYSGGFTYDVKVVEDQFVKV